MDLLCKRQLSLFTHCSSTVHALKNIKNRSHGIIHTFKNYFTTVFSVFSFSKNKLYPNGSLIGLMDYWAEIKICRNSSRSVEP